MGDETLSAVTSWDGHARAGTTEYGAGALVGRYQVRRLIGEGGMGRVYLARDTTLGRSVALKVLSSNCHDGAAIGEARTTARFNHPHIVQLYDVGQVGDATYLALEYLEGESLRERARRERLSVDEVIRIGRAVADALAHAHAVGVRHCDLKASNVMLPRDGRVRVVDFGLASTSHRGGVAGTPDAMAPEQWRGERPTDSVDVWALGVMLHELFTGEHPFGPAVDAHARRASVFDRVAEPIPVGIPGTLAALIRRSLSSVMNARPTAREWLLTLDELLGGGAALARTEAPYRGLAAFDAADCHLFHGRDAEVDELLERMRATSLIAIVGPSGAGKSSMLHAGVIPRLLARGRWKVFTARPGATPFLSIARCLIDADEPDAAQRAIELAIELQATPTLLALRLSTIALAEQTQVLLVIDQLEELFTQDVSATQVAAFIAMLATASDEASDPARVMVTLRDDFSGRFAVLRDVFVLRPLAPPELRRAIVQPLRQTSFRFEDSALVDQMIADLGEEANLPMLQFACRALWDARDEESHTLTRAAYREIGGIGGALARHADRFLAQRDARECDLVRVVLLRLVVGTSTRRILERPAVILDLPVEAEAALDSLVAARLVIQRRARVDDAVYVEIAHESLLVCWDQLRTWIERTAEQRQLVDELSEAAAVWSRRGAADEATWSETEIGAARLRASTLHAQLPAVVEAFLAAGERHHARRRRRARRRTIIALVGAGGVAVSALGVAQVFRSQRIEAELARGNLGASLLVLAPFEWDEGRQLAVPATDLPGLRWELHAPDPIDVTRPGKRIPNDLVRAGTPAIGDVLAVSLEAPGGLSYLRVDGRGRQGDECPPSWIRLEALPGYASRDAGVARLEIPVPTCRASQTNMVEVPEGDAIYGGLGEPRTQFADYAERERIVHVARFVIDRTETANLVFAPFASMSAITGYPRPVYPTEVSPHEHDADPDMPVTSIDAEEAEAFCRYMGKRLPSDFEWTKAARGGIELYGHKNPSPRRLFPAGGAENRRCVNGNGTDDGYVWLAPVAALGCGASPYDVLQLAGNVAEWISLDGESDPDAPLRVVRGGAANSPWELEQVTTIFRNTREGRYFDFSIGVRCVEGPPLSPHEGG